MNYERGLERMRQLLVDTVNYQKFLLFEFRLRENLQNDRYYGTNEQMRSDRARILEQLNRLALEYSHTSFNDLCIEVQSSNVDAREPVLVANGSTIATCNVTFISCSDEDQKYKEELYIHLAQTMNKDTQHIWDHTKIQPGTKWREELIQALQMTRIAVLLISAYFFASESIYKYELPYFLAAAEHKELTIFCVILRHCSFASSDLAVFKTVNDPDRPLNALSQSERDAVWVKVANLIDGASKS